MKLELDAMKKDELQKEALELHSQLKKVLLDEAFEKKEKGKLR